MFGKLKQDTPGIASVYFRGSPAPRAEEFSFLQRHGIEVSPGRADDSHWALRLRHRDWGEADLVCLRDMRPPPAAMLEHATGLAQDEKEQGAAASTAVTVHTPATRKDILRERKHTLRFARAVLGDDGVIVADHGSGRFWSRRTLDEELTHDADLDISALYMIHAVASDDDPERVDWLHSHGLDRAGRFDFDIVRPSEDLLNPGGDDILRAAAFAILEGAVSDSTPRFPLARPGGTVRFVPAARFQSLAAPADRAARAHDEDHNDRRAVLCDPPGKFLGRFSSRVKPSRFLSGALDEVGINFSSAASELMASRARDTLHLLPPLLDELAEFQFPAIAKMAYETADGGAEHLWFAVHAVNGDRIDATLESQPFNVPGMSAGDRAEHGVERLSDWAVMTLFGPINPRTQVVRRMIDENRDTLLGLMRQFEQDQTD